VPIDAANTVLLSAIALGLVGAVLLALRAFRRSPWLVFLAFPLIYDVNNTYGYFAFRLSVVLALVTLAVLRLDLRRPRLWREALLAGLAILAFFTHAHGFAILVILALVVVGLCSSRPSAAARAVAAGLPAVALAAWWYIPALFGGAADAKIHAPHLPLIRLMELVPHRALNSFKADGDEIVALGLLLTWAGLVLASPRPEAEGWRARLAAHAPELLAGLMLVAYFAVPNQLITPTQRIYGINYRLLLVVCVLAVLVPRIDLRRWRLVAVLPVVALALWFGLIVHEEYERFHERYRVFDEVVAAMEPGRKVMAYTYQTWDPHFTVPMLGHFVGYYHARKGGAPSAAHTFATYAYMPVKLKHPRRHPEPRRRGPLNWRRLRSTYDYFLVGDSFKSHRTPFNTRGLRLVVEAGLWQVWEKQ
jgi:hypothetical protein